MQRFGFVYTLIMEYNSFPIQEHKKYSDHWGSLSISPVNSMTYMYNKLPFDESFFNALVHQTSDAETFGHNDSTFHNLVEHCSGKLLGTSGAWRNCVIFFHIYDGLH